MAVDTLGVILAAGQSRRFGPQNKLLAEIDGVPMVALVARALAAARVDKLAAIVSDHVVFGALPAGYDEISIPSGQDMAISFRRAINVARAVNARRLLIALGDMPNVRASTFDALLALGADGACISNGRRLPPVVLMATSYDACWRDAVGDAGARGIISKLPMSCLVAVSPDDALDIDTPADIAFNSR